MNKKKKAIEEQSSRWEQIIKERQSSGETVKVYCKRLGIHEKVYYYWQRKLRKAANQQMTQSEQKTTNTTIVPNGWAVCESALPANNVKEITIQIGKSRIMAKADSDLELLAKVCRMLITLC
jgi:transposase-like protein